VIDSKAVAGDNVDGNPVSGEAATGDTVASKIGTDNTGDGSAVSGADFAVSGEAVTGDTVASKTGTDNTVSGKTGDGSTVSGESEADFAGVVCSGGDSGIAGDGGSVGEVTVQAVGAVLIASTLAVCTTSIWNFSFFFAFLLQAVWGQ
jgi:hypothetical protein